MWHPNQNAERITISDLIRHGISVVQLPDGLWYVRVRRKKDAFGPNRLEHFPGVEAHFVARRVGHIIRDILQNNECPMIKKRRRKRRTSL